MLCASSAVFWCLLCCKLKEPSGANRMVFIVRIDEAVLSLREQSMVLNLISHLFQFNNLCSVIKFLHQCINGGITCNENIGTDYVSLISNKNRKATFTMLCVGPKAMSGSKTCTNTSFAVLR